MEAKKNLGKNQWGGPVGSGYGKGPGPSFPPQPSGRGNGNDRTVA